MSTEIQEVKNIVIQNFRTLLSSDEFQAWLTSDEKHKEGLIIVNNSFVYRDVKTNKNRQYLATEVDDEGKLGKDIWVIRDFSMNSSFKFISAKAKNRPSKIELEKALEVEVSDIGDLVFILIGKVDDNVQLDEEVSTDGFERIVWDPKQNVLVSFDDTTISVNETYDEQAVWDEICVLYKADEEEPDIELRKDVGRALDKLQDRAKAILTIPNEADDLGFGVTDAIIKILKEERARYADALSKCGGNPDNDQAAFNEILRISYNFASDATTFLRLVVSVCDLKPIVMWGTISYHYNLSSAFRQLPWERSRKKPSLKNYIDVIGDARNSAFHNLFPFRKTLEISLPESSVKGAALSIFSEYTKKKNNRLVYKDKELVDVLTEFTRARQRQIPSRFWSSNLNVMDATISLFESTNEFLKHLRGNGANTVSTTS